MTQTIQRSLSSSSRLGQGARQPKLRHVRRVLPYLGAMLLLALIVYGFWPKPSPVETASVVRGVVRQTIHEEGKTRIKQRFTVSATVAGQLRRIPFKPGAEVKAVETVVAVIDPLAPTILDARSRKLAEARRETAAANLDRARAAHKFAASELQRMETLAKEKTVSAQDLENAQLRETSTAKDFSAAEANLRQADAELADFPQEGNSPSTPVQLTSPISGRVLRVFEESTRAVTMGTPLLEVGNPADLEAVIEVLSRDGAAIKPGARVELEQWGGSQALEGVVRLVEPSAFTKISALGVEEQRVNLVVDILTPVDQRGNLGDNFRVEGRVVTGEAANTLKIPSGALFRNGGEQAVFVFENGSAKIRNVKVGLTSATEAQILEGLKEQEKVIVYPGDRVKDGDRVQPIQVSADP